MSKTRKSKVTSNKIGGYEYQFVNTPHERYICKICIHPCQDTYLSVCCGHNFCKSCLDKVKKSSTSFCPICRNEKATTFPNIQADREIRSLHVMCTNKGRGCEWQGELNNINNHLGNSDGCQFEDVQCSNKCGKMLQRRYLPSHVETECPSRIVKCPLCQISGGHRFIVGEHKEQCPKLPMSCPNKCMAKKIAREDMEAHRKECPLEMVQCDYHNVGCEERMLRKRKKNHEEEKMEEHLLMTTLKLANTEDKLVSTETRLGSLEVMVHRLINTTGSCNKLIESSQWYSHLTTLATRVVAVTQITPVILKMSNFAENKETYNVWSSEPFFSHNRGYKMTLLVYPAGDGDGEGTHLSVFLHLMKGPHDDKLAWPLRGRFEIKLLNQISDCEHYSQTVIYDHRMPGVAENRVISCGISEGWGKQQFVHNEDLSEVSPTCQYLKNDCIFIEVNKL
ncbi:TNF receptor-associated factor 4-like [Dysidea avara]|uniref:TNF receptor-associated factor 4-like n=1 Tax=Dysidea avara TaxID=196820 RepID=UPI003324E726